MTKLKSKRLLSLLLSLAMVFTLFAAPVFAADTDTSGGVTTESTADESEEAASSDSDETESESEFTAESVQAMIDALPDAEDITADNAADVEAQLDAVDAARAEIGEDADYLDYTKYDAACAALEALYSAEDDSSDGEDEEVDEFLPDIELPDGVERSGKIAAAGGAAAVDGDTTYNVSYNGTAYESVTAAISAIDESGTITLTGDVSEATITIPSGKTITLDLGEYTLTLTGGTTYTDTGYTESTFSASLVNQGSLTVQNGTIQGNGTYTTDNTNYYYVNNTILNTGTLEIKNEAAVNGMLYVITNLGGTVTTAGDITATYYDAIYTCGGSVTIDGGTITATNSSYDGSAVDIFDRCCDSTSSAATVTMNDGTINAYCYGFSTNNLYSGNSSLTILGGKVETVFACIYWPSPGTITIGKEDSESDDTPYLLNTGGSGIVICCGTLNVYSGTIEATYAATEDTPYDSTTWAEAYRAHSGAAGLGDAITVAANRSSGYAQYALTINLSGGTYISASNYAVRYMNCNAASDSDTTDTSQAISVTLSGGTYTGGTTTDGSAVAAVDTCEYEDTSEISTLTVTGGTYSSDVSAYTTSTSTVIYTTGDDGNAVYTVVETDIDAVAVVYDANGDYTSYTSLSDAFSNAVNGCTIALISDVTVTDAEYNGDGYYQVSGKTVTLNLNNYTLSVDTTRILGVKNAGILNIENGTIEIADNTSSTYAQFNMVRGDSAFTATNVTFDANEIGTYAVYIASNAAANVEMTNCTFTDLKNAVVFDADNASTVTLTGCTYSKQPFSTSTFNTIENYTVVIDENSPSDSGYEYNNGYTLFFNYVVADGGTISSESTVVVNSYFGTASLTVEDGGEVEADVKVNDDTSMTLEGGTVTGTITVVKEGSTEEAAAISEEDEEDESDYTVTGGLLTISGGTITGQIKSSGTLIMTGGTVKDNAETGYSDGVVYILNGNVYVSGGSVTGTKRGFGFAGSGSISGEISGGSITGSDIALMVRANESNTVKVSGGSYTATNALYLANESDESTIFADGCSAYNTEGTALSSITSGTVTLYKSALSDKTVIVADSVPVAAATTDSTTTYYTTVQAAIEVAAEGTTIKLLSDVTEDITVASGKNVTLDLAGCTITSSASHTIEVQYGATLTIEDSVGDGKVQAAVSGYAALYNQGTVVAQGGYFTRTAGTGYTIVNDGWDWDNDGDSQLDPVASMTFESGVTVETPASVDNNSSMIRNYGGTITINGGTFTSDSLSCIKNEPKSTLTINGGTIKNLAESASKKQGAIINAGTVTVTDGTIYSYSSAIFGTSSSYYGRVSITGGTFYNLNTSVASALIGSYQYNTETDSATCYVSGGTFNGYSVYPKYLASDKYSLFYNFNASDSYSSWIVTVQEDASELTYEAMRKTTYGTVYLADADVAFNTTYFSGNDGTVYLYAALNSVTGVKVNTTGYTLVLMNTGLSTSASDYTSRFTCYTSTGFELLSTTGTTTYNGESYNTVTIYQGVTETSANASITVDDETIYYATAVAAVTAANSMSNDDITVKVERSHSSTGAMVPKRSMTIDLNGCEVKSTNSYGVIRIATSDITVTVTDSGTDGTGSMVKGSNTSKLCTVTAGTLVLESGAYRGVFTGVSGGTLSITGGYYTSDPSDYAATGYEAVSVEYTLNDVAYSYQVKAKSTTLGISDSDDIVIAENITGEGESVMYAKVSADNISSNYDIDSYPTTSLTFTETTTDDEGSETTTTHNYIFAGWYSYSDDAYSAMESFPTDTAYAKFVDACFLTVQCYVTNDCGTYYWRFVTSLDTLYYNAAGFEIHVGDSTDAGELESVSYTKKYTIKNSTTKVEESADGETAGTTETISGSAVILPSQIHSEATYLVTAAYKDTESSAGKIKVTPYWVTGDGTTVYGNAAAFIYAYPAGE